MSEVIVWCDEHKAQIVWGGMCGHPSRFDSLCRPVDVYVIPLVGVPEKDKEGRKT